MFTIRTGTLKNIEKKNGFLYGVFSSIKSVISGRTLQPYGIKANPPKNAQIIGLPINNSNFYVLATNTEEQELRSGEVVVSNAVSGVKIHLKENGKVSIFNNDKNLATLLEELITEIKNLQTFGSPTNHTVSPASKTLLDTWLNKLKELIV